MVIKTSAALVFPSIFTLIFLSILSPAVAARAKCNPQDNKVLLQIKAAFNNKLSTWITDEDCCKWYDSDVICNPNTGRVISLSIFSVDGFSGQIPPAVGDLSYLQKLEIEKFPNLTGPIPAFISKLNQLKYLGLSSNNLTGPIPSFLGQLKNLIVLDLSFNQLTGSIPPSLFQLPNLLDLHLDRNRLTGTIPDVFGWAAARNTTPHILLSDNLLTGPVPKSFDYLDSIDLSSNRLEGNPSFLFRKGKSIQDVDLSRNNFEFDLSKVEFTKNLSRLNLNHNKIFGSLPQGLTQLNLEFLDVSYNRLCGKIPQGGELQRFDISSYFHNKCLCGAPLPPCRK